MIIPAHVSQPHETPSGLPTVGGLRWGSHFCQLYRTAEDLADILVPFFKAGLDHNERCLWIASAPLPAREARQALADAIPELASLEARGQIEILDHEAWYLAQGKLGPDDVIAGWLERETHALRDGYEGLRLSGNTYWLEQQHWQDFADYEARVHAAFHGRRILALCSYSLDRCSSSDLLDVLANHHTALVRRDRRWEVVQSATAVMAEVEHDVALDQAARCSEPQRSEAEVARQLEKERKRLLEAERKALAYATTTQRHLARLQQITSALSEAATVKDVCRALARHASQVAGASEATIAVVDENGALWSLDESGGRHTQAESSRNTPSALLDAHQSSAPIWVPAAATQNRENGIDICAAVLPLTLGPRRLGVVTFSFTAPLCLNTSNRALLVDLAHQLTLALHRAMLYEAAENANLAKDEFLAMLGHELRNPLSPMLTALEVMRLNAGDVALKERAVIERQLRHMV